MNGLYTKDDLFSELDQKFSPTKAQSSMIGLAQPPSPVVAKTYSKDDLFAELDTKFKLEPMQPADVPEQPGMGDVKQFETTMPEYKPVEPFKGEDDYKTAKGLLVLPKDIRNNALARMPEERRQAVQLKVDELETASPTWGGLTKAAGAVTKQLGKELFPYSDPYKSKYWQKRFTKSEDELKDFANELRAGKIEGTPSALQMRYNAFLEDVNRWEKNPEKQKKIREKGEEIVQIGKVLDPFDYKKYNIEQRIDDLKEEDSATFAALKRGDLGFAISQAIGDAVISGDEKQAKEAIELKKQYEKEASLPAEERKGLKGLYISTLEMLAPMVKTGAKMAVPVVGKAWGGYEWAKQGAGDVYQELIESGVSHETASKIAPITGAIYAGIEQIQVGQLANIGQKISKNLADKSIKKVLLNLAKEKGKDYLKEVREEAFQRIVTDVGTEIGKQVDGVSDKELIDIIKDTSLGALEEAKGAAGPMGVLSALGLGAGAVSQTMQQKGVTDAEEIRTDQEVLPEKREVGEGIQEVGGDDVQQIQEAKRSEIAREEEKKPEVEEQLKPLETKVEEAKKEEPLKKEVSEEEKFVAETRPEIIKKQKEVAEAKKQEVSKPSGIEPAPKVEKPKPAVEKKVEPIKETKEFKKSFDEVKKLVPKELFDKIDISVEKMAKGDKGSIQEDNGRLKIKIDENLKPEDVGRVLFHEVAGHAGTANVLKSNSKIYKRLNTLYKSSESNIFKKKLRKTYNQEIDAMLKNGKDEKDVEDLVFSEWIAHNVDRYLANPQEKKGLPYQIYRTVKDFLISIGLKKDTLDDALRSLVKEMPRVKKPEAIKGVELKSKELKFKDILELDEDEKLPKKVTGANLEKIYNKGLDKLSAGDKEFTVKQLIKETAKEYKTPIDERRRGTMKLEQIREMADRQGMTASTLIKRGLGKAYNAEELVRAHDLMTTSAQRLAEKHRALIKKGKENISEKDIVDFRIAMQEHAAIQAEFSGARAEAGRALGALRIMSKAITDKNYDEVLDALGGKELNEKVIEKIIAMDPDNEVAVNKFVEQLHKATLLDKLHEYWINSILSAPTTHIVNITSNALTSLTKPLLETPVAALIDAPNRFSKNKRNVYLRQIPAQFVGMMEGAREGVQAAGKAFSEEMPQFSKTTKLEQKRFQAIPGKFGRFIRTPGRALMAADEFFKYVIYRSEINTLAYKEARALGLKGEKLAEKMAELKLNPTKQMTKKAMDEAAYRTFTNPMGPWTKKMASIRGDVIIGGKKYFNPVKLALPFVNTPTNIAKFALERTPVGFVTKAKRAIGKDIKPEEIAEEFAKPVAGSIIILAALGLAQQGLITGAGPKDKEERENLYRTGWQPYSIKIGDKYYSFARLEPLGSLLGMTADYASVREDDSDLEDIAETMGYSIGRNITSKTYMKGLSDLINAVSDPERYGERYIQTMAGSIVPNIVASFGRATDKQLREVDNLIDTYKSRFPGISKMLKPRRDIWGRKIDRAGNFWTKFLSPIQYRAIKGDKIDQEMLDIGLDVRIPTDKFKLNRHQKKVLGIEDKKKNYLELNSDEYEKYQVLSGIRARKVIERLVRTYRYKKASKEERARMAESAIKKSRVQARRYVKLLAAKRYIRDNKIKVGVKLINRYFAT